MSLRNRDRYMKHIVIWVFALLALATSALAQNYQLRPGDVLSIEVLEDSSLNRDTFILPDGSINFPLAGSIQAGGRTVSQVQANLTARLAPNFAAPPTVFVTVTGLAPSQEERAADLIDVYISGEANNPGKRQIEAGTSLVQFLAETGGFTRFAAIKRLQLRRNVGGTERIFIVNYRKIERGAAVRSNIIMQDGDVLVVPVRRLFE